MDTRANWSGVRDRVTAMVEARRRADGWGFGRGSSGDPVFEPVLTAAEIAEVEAQYGVELPEEYRTFLAEVGAGGPGPEFGLTSVRRVDGKWGFWERSGRGPVPLDMSGPFVETEDWIDQQMATLRAAGYEPTTRDEDNDYLDDYLKAFGGPGEMIWAEERFRGSLLIGDYGCGMSGRLVVVGPHRGELRDRDVGFNEPLDPSVDAHGNRHNFRTWYLEWLERCEEELR
jgi:SMI1 / KNR4 family (SUKH-1)